MIVSYVCTRTIRRILTYVYTCLASGICLVVGTESVLPPGGHVSSVLTRADPTARDSEYRHFPGQYSNVLALKAQRVLVIPQLLVYPGIRQPLSRSSAPLTADHSLDYSQ